jgi:hypothetical protein
MFICRIVGESYMWLLARAADWGRLTAHSEVTLPHPVLTACHVESSGNWAGQPIPQSQGQWTWLSDVSRFLLQGGGRTARPVSWWNSGGNGAFTLPMHLQCSLVG